MVTKDWLVQTTADKLMVRDVRTLRPADTLAEAADLFLGEQLSGAPVVDGSGVCVGVLSASDLLGADKKVATRRKREAESSFWHSQLALPVSVYESRLSEIRDKIGPAAEQPVERFMTQDVVSVGPSTTVADIIRSMVNAHIHRVIVVDAQRRLLGIVSTIDVLAALIRVQM